MAQKAALPRGSRDVLSGPRSAPNTPPCRTFRPQRRWKLGGVGPGPERVAVEERRETQMTLAPGCCRRDRLSRCCAGLQGTDPPKRRFRPTSG